MESLKAAIDTGTKVCGSRKALGERIGETPQNIASVYAGRRGFTPETCANLGRLLGVDPLEILGLNAAEREPDQTKRERLKRLLFSRATLGGVVACLIAATLAGTHGRAEARAVGGSELTLDTLARVLLALMTRCRGLVLMARRGFRLFDTDEAREHRTGTQALTVQRSMTRTPDAGTALALRP